MKTFVLFILLLKLASVFPDMRMTGKRVDCREFNKDYINVTCSIKLKDRFTQLYSTRLELKPGVVIRNLKIKAQSFYKFRTEYRPVGIKIQEDACAFLKFANATKLLSFSYFKNLPADLNVQCPLSRPMEINNFEIVHPQMPPIIPTGEYRFTTIAETRVKGKDIFLVKFVNVFECSEIFEN